jgi:aminoglycoside phosphotransferase
MTAPDSLAGLDTSVFWFSNQAGGWVHLLPPLTKRRILCITPYDAVEWMLASECAHLTRLSLEHSSAPGHSDSPNVERLGVEQLLGRMAAEPGWDGLIVHDPEGELVHRQSHDEIARLLASIGPRLGPQAFVYLGVANPWSVQRMVHALHHRRDGRPAPCELGEIERLMRAAGWAHGARHPMLMDGSRIFQVLGESGYQSSKNYEKRRERAKEWLLGRRGAARFAPAYALVGLGIECERPVLDQLLARVGHLNAPAGATPAVLKEYLILGGHKAVISMGSKGDDRHDVVAIMAGDSLATERRLGESATLARLTELGGEFAQMFPRTLDRFDIGSAHCFLITRIPGVTLDQDTVALEPVTDAALDFLTRFHQRTATRVTIGSDKVASLAWALVDAAKGRNEPIADDLETWKAPLRRCLEGLTLPLVWMHGDYKIENVMYDPDTRQITGVIDWEHAIIPGLPLLDAMFLMVFNRIARGSHHIEAIDALFARDQIDDRERARLARYCDALQIPARSVRALNALFLAHHIGHRIHMYQEAAGWERVRQLVRRLGSRIEAEEVTTT